MQTVFPFSGADERYLLHTQLARCFQRWHSTGGLCDLLLLQRKVRHWSLQIAVAYTQFVTEVLRQLVDEPLIPFNVTDYAVVIEKQAAEHLARFQNEYRLLASHLDESGRVTRLVSE